MSITRGQVVQGVRDRLADDAATPFYSDALLNRLINERVLALATTIIPRLDPSFYLAEQTITSVADTADYAVASAFNSLMTVERKYGTGTTATYVPVPIVPIEDQGDGLFPMMALPDTIARVGKSVSLIGTNLRFTPIPVDTSEVYRVKYLRRTTDLDPYASGTAVDAPDTWLNVLILEVVKVIFARKGDPRLNNVIGEIASETQLIRKHARRRTAPQPVRHLGRL